MELPRAAELCGLLLAAIGISAVATPSSAHESRARFAPSFVITFTTVLLLGARSAMAVAVAGTIASALAHPLPKDRYRRILLNVAAIIIAIQAASTTHRLLGGTLRHFEWPWQAVPLAVAVAAYCFVMAAITELVWPLFAKRPVARSWPADVLRQWPVYFIAASLAVGIVEVIDHRGWDLLMVAAVPLFLAHRALCEHANRVEQEHRYRELVGFLNEGVAILDGHGRVTHWSDVLERMLGCPREAALDRQLARALPSLEKTELPRAVAGVLTSRKPHTVTNLTLPSTGEKRILRVQIQPIEAGVALLWHDETEKARAERALGRNEARLTLAAEGAHDGLWEWDLRDQQFFFSSRWRALLGLPPSGGVGRPNEWFDRVHPDDLGPLKDAFEAHFSGKADHVQHEHRIRHEDGSYRLFLCRGIADRGAGRRAQRIAGSLTDTTERARAVEQLRSAGFLDPLTGLCNRAVFVEGLGRRLEQFKQRRGGERFAVLYLDLDRFKIVNDSLGHLIGDQLLISVSRRLEACLRPGDSLARLGGDEFAILLNALQDEQQSNAIAFQIQEALSAPFSIGGREVFTSASIGIAPGLRHYANPDEIMRDADTAMYQAKASGKARHELFDADMHARARDRLGLENDLRHAVKRNDFEMHYQPIVSLSSGMCVGFESLIRWNRNGRLVSPAIFIPVAEELGVIEPLGTWVLEQACRTFADWQRRYPRGGLDCITVNVSSRQLMQQHFPYIVEQAVEQAGLKPGALRLEITETALLDSPTVAAEALRRLRDFGVKIYLDDFGTGYSSLSHLHKLPVDALKIDQSFVRSLALPNRPAIVESILALARTLNTSVVAEGIESDEQARELERLGCTHAQGYLFSRPLSTALAEQLILANQPLGEKRRAAEPCFASSGKVTE